ncbi:hypothetical protein [Marinimicrobium locisalis]|uniref:hypothetical protein n=1 Tax=Marinimicrobium locisalis TaxID=546022 RepID=UPI0032221B5D
MAERNGDTKDTLLEELESIKGLLDDEDAIPVLREVIESIEPLEADEPRQPSLFRSADTRPASRKGSGGVTRASGENPFLPAHIRARLHGNRPPPSWGQPVVEGAEEAAIQPTAATKGPAPAENSAPPSTPQALITRQRLIDQVVQESLPEMEAKLRRRLHEASDEQLRHWLDTPPDD